MCSSSELTDSRLGQNASRTCAFQMECETKRPPESLIMDPVPPYDRTVNGLLTETLALDILTKKMQNELFTSPLYAMETTGRIGPIPVYRTCARHVICSMRATGRSRCRASAALSAIRSHAPPAFRTASIRSIRTTPNNPHAVFPHSSQ